MPREEPAARDTRERDLVLDPFQYAFILDETKAT